MFIFCACILPFSAVEVNFFLNEECFSGGLEYVYITCLFVCLFALFVAKFVILFVTWSLLGFKT